MSRPIDSYRAACLLLIPIVTAAADGPPRDSAGGGGTLDTIIVTGSYIRRTDIETPAAVTVLGADEIVKQGFNSLADAIRSITADSSGTLGQAFSGAAAGGASGVSLRGLSVDATLVLMDGHRLAPYPLADDGQRPFTDISSLPLGIVDHIEVLQDGASAIYGSDAIAGVVNVITKKQFTGLDLTASLGSTYRWDGQSQRFGATFGAGDLAADGHNFYFNVEFRHQEAISQEARGSYISALDLTQYGGPDLRGGIINGNLPLAGTTYTVPGQVAPLIGGQPADVFFQLPGCAAQNVVPNGGGCAWDTNRYKKLQPRTEGLNVSAHWTEHLGGDWSNGLSVNYFLSQAEQYRQPNAYNVGIPLVPFVWAGSKSGIVNQFDTTTTQIVLPAGSLDNPFNPASPYAAAAQAFYGAAFAGYVGQPALFYGALTEFPPQHSLYYTDVYRLVDDLTGTVGAWDLAVAAGYVRDETHVTYQGFVNVSTLNAAFANGTLRVGQNASLNSPALIAGIVPETHDVAISDIAFLSANASRKLLPLPGGDLAVAAGVEARLWQVDNPGQPGAPEGNILMDGSFYARGSQTVQAAFVEFSAPLLHSLEVDAAARVDHYQAAGTAVTPKFGFKWKIVPQLALRGTYARGFRAPGIAESGNAGIATSVAPAPLDPVRCPATGAAADCSGQGSAVAILTRSNPNLQPEKSRSYTIGLIVEPLKDVNLTVDYFNIRRTNEITPAPYTLDNAVRTPAAPGASLPGTIVEYIIPYVNASYSLVSGLDSELKTGISLADYGKLSLRLDVTHLIKSEQTVDGSTFHWVGTVGPTALSGSVGTPATRASASLDWTIGPASTGVTFNYRSAMRGIDESLGGTCLQLGASNPHCYVAGFGYASIYGQYRWNAHLDVTATLTNITNRLPPLDTVTYGGQNYDASLDQAGAIGRYLQAAFHYQFEQARPHGHDDDPDRSGRLARHDCVRVLGRRRRGGDRARDGERGRHSSGAWIMASHLELAVAAGPMTLLYPKWLPGRHSPAGPLTSLGGPRFSAGAQTIPWQRDPIDLNAFHLVIPPGVTRLGVDLEMLTAPAPDGLVQGLEAPRAATESLLILEWNQLVLYPAGRRTDDLVFQAEVRLPKGWKYATALSPGEGHTEGKVRFAPVSLTTLVDSTLLAGRYFLDLPLGGTPAVTLHVAADTMPALNMKSDTQAHYRRLVREAAALFGATHYGHYEFLWSLTDQIMPDGIEHHESSDNRSPLRALLDDPTRRAEANLLPHEYVHSWNGKFRRPVGLATPDYQMPMRDELLWVYEGLTEYLGDVLAARSGLLTEQEFRDELARIAAAMDSHSAREWRSLQETTIAAPLLYYQSRNWAARLRRQEDFYQESALLWLEADSLIRRGSKGRKSLDDFCKLFYGGPSTGPRVETYDFDGLVNALNAVYPHDWAGFWNQRLNRLRPQAPLEGLKSAGWRLALTSTPSSMHLAHETDDKNLDLRYSLGFYVDDQNATIGDVIPRSPADVAGVSPGSHVMALNGYKWSKELLHDTLAAPADPAGTIHLLVEKDDTFRTLELDYTGGERYPNLLREAGEPDLLQQIAHPRTGDRG